MREHRLAQDTLPPFDEVVQDAMQRGYTAISNRVEGTKERLRRASADVPEAAYQRAMANYDAAKSALLQAQGAAREVAEEKFEVARETLREVVGAAYMKLHRDYRAALEAKHRLEQEAAEYFASRSEATKDFGRRKAAEAGRFVGEKWNATKEYGARKAADASQYMRERMKATNETSPPPPSSKPPPRREESMRPAVVPKYSQSRCRLDLCGTGECTKEIVNRRFREEAIKVHPDKGPSGEKKDREDAFRLLEACRKSLLRIAR